MSVQDHARTGSPVGARPAFPLLRGLGVLLGICLMGATEEVNARNTCPDDTEMPKSSMVVVLGAGGTKEYTATFAEWASRWEAAAAASDVDYYEIGAQGGNQTDRELLHRRIVEQDVETNTPLWIILIGHGTYDGNAAKFNLRGPDISATELASWCKGFRRPLILINCSSSSGPFVPALQGEDRVIITATNSGAEQNYARFGGFLSDALHETAADLDHDEQISLLEAFLFASSRVARFYEEHSRLATEHALLEDNADGKGTPADFFVGIRVGRKARDGAAPDGRLAHRFILVPAQNAPQLSPEQIAERDRLEARIEALRDQKSSLPTDDYYQQLEPLLVDLARLYAEVRRGDDAHEVN